MHFQKLILLATCVLAASVYADECDVSVPVGLTKTVSCHGKKITRVKCPNDKYSTKKESDTKWKVSCGNWIENCDCTVFTE